MHRLPQIFYKWTSHIFAQSERDLRQRDPISPLLFVLGLEYLHRSLASLQNNLNFNFHPRCEKLCLANICFADDLVILTIGDALFVSIMMNVFKEFSYGTGLKAHPARCKLYFRGVSHNVQQEIMEGTRFQIRDLPFKYLGVLLASNKLTIA